MPIFYLAIGGTGSDGSWGIVGEDGTGPLESVEYTPKSGAYVDFILVRYVGIVAGSDFVFAMGLRLSFDTPTSGRFTGSTNGRPATVAGTFELVP